MEKVSDTTIELLANTYDYFLFDCDGVIWEGASEIEGSIKALNYLKSLGKKLFFLSNNSTKSRKDYVTELGTHGYTAEITSIISSSYTMASLLATHYPTYKTAYIVGEKGLVEELEAVGIACFGHSHDSKVDFTTLGDPKKIDIPHMDAVIVGLDKEYNYYKLFMASNMILKGAKFFATNTDSFSKIGSHKYPGAGSMVTSIQAPTNVRPLVIGKPNVYFLDTIMAKEGLTNKDKHRILMVGDRMDTDIKFAENGQIDSCLVLTGATTLAEFQELKVKEGSLKPTYCMEKLGTFKVSNK